MKILLMGPPASGKGTIGKMLSEKLGIPLISNGALLRALTPEHPYYERVHQCMSLGELVPQDILAELLNNRTQEEDCKNGFIIDGWGRALIDLEYYDPGFDKVVVINISDETAMRRITGRRLCTSNGKVYNIYTLPKEELKECEGELVQREDDTPEIVARRLKVQKINPEVLDYFRKQNNLVFVDGEPMPEIIFEEVLGVLGINDKYKK